MPKTPEATSPDESSHIDTKRGFPTPDVEASFRQTFFAQYRDQVGEILQANNPGELISDTQIDLATWVYYGYFFVNHITQGKLLDIFQNQIAGESPESHFPLHAAIATYPSLQGDRETIAHFDPVSNKICLFLKKIPHSKQRSRVLFDIPIDSDLTHILIGIHETLHFYRHNTDHIRPESQTTQSKMTAILDRMLHGISISHAISSKEEFLSYQIMGQYIQQYWPEAWPQVEPFFTTIKRLYTSRRAQKAPAKK